MMKKFRVFLCIVASLFTVYTIFGFINANAKTVAKPKLIFVSKPNAEYKKGDRVTFQVKAPNYNGKVQYRVILWNFAKKTQVELYPNMKKYGYYNVKSSVKGTSSFTVSFPVNEEGIYKISVLVKRAGVKVPYDSYVVTSSFVVDPIKIIETGAILNDGTILKAQKYNTENLYTLDLSSLKSGVGVKTYISTNKDSVLSYLNYKFNLKASEKKVFGLEDFGKVDNPPSGVNIDTLREMANKDGYINDSITLSRGSLVQKFNLKIKVK